MQQHRTALNVTQEPVTNTTTLMGPFNQTRDICDHKLIIIYLRHPKAGIKRRKGVIGNFRMRISRFAQKG